MEGQESYLPSARSRFYEILSTLRRVWRPPPFEWPPNAALVVLDAIEAYRSMYTPQTVRNIQRLIDAAKTQRIPIIMSRWTRLRTENDRDAIDRKGHWSFYVPSQEQSQILTELRVPSFAQEVLVEHTNLFVHRDAWSVPEGAHLVVCGSWTESCVMNTTRAALDLNHSVTVVPNACTGHFPSAFLALYSMQLAYTDLRNLEERAEKPLKNE